MPHSLLCTEVGFSDGFNVGRGHPMVGKDGGGQNLFLVKLFLLEVKLSLVPWILHDVNRLDKIEGLICGPHLVQCTLSPLLTPPPLPAPVLSSRSVTRLKTILSVSRGQ